MRKLLLLLCAGLFVATAYAMEGAAGSDLAAKSKAANDAIATLKTGVATAVKTLVEKITLKADTKCETAQTTATAEATKAKEDAKTQVDAAMAAIENITAALATAQTEITGSIEKMVTE